MVEVPEGSVLACPLQHRMSLQWWWGARGERARLSSAARGGPCCKCCLWCFGLPILLGELDRNLVLAELQAPPLVLVRRRALLRRVELDQREPLHSPEVGGVAVHVLRDVHITHRPVPPKRRPHRVDRDVTGQVTGDERLDAHHERRHIHAGGLCSRHQLRATPATSGAAVGAHHPRHPTQGRRRRLHRIQVEAGGRRRMPRPTCHRLRVVEVQVAPRGVPPLHRPHQRAVQQQAAEARREINNRSHSGWG
jgi:hypothetical protein